MTQIRALVAGQHQELARLTGGQRARAARISREALARVQGILSEAEAGQLREFDATVLALTAVDDFDAAELQSRTRPVQS